MSVYATDSDRAPAFKSRSFPSPRLVTLVWLPVGCASARFARACGLALIAFAVHHLALRMTAWPPDACRSHRTVLGADGHQELALCCSSVFLRRPFVDQTLFPEASRFQSGVDSRQKRDIDAKLTFHAYPGQRGVSHHQAPAGTTLHVFTERTLRTRKASSDKCQRTAHNITRSDVCAVAPTHYMHADGPLPTTRESVAVEQASDGCKKFVRQAALV